MGGMEPKLHVPLSLESESSLISLFHWANQKARLPDFVVVE